MSTSLEAAAAATVLQLVCAGYGVDISTKFTGRRWQALIVAETETWHGRSDQVLAAFAEAMANAEENASVVLATMHAADPTTDLGDAWRAIAAIASEFDYVGLFPVHKPERLARGLEDVPTIGIKANGHELGIVDVFFTLPEDPRERMSGRALLEALTRLDRICQSALQTTEPAPPLRGNDPAPTSGTIEA